jgi:hypothetical protein
MNLGPLTSKKLFEVLQTVVADLGQIKADLAAIRAELKGKKDGSSK